MEFVLGLLSGILLCIGGIVGLTVWGYKAGYFNVKK